MAEEKLKIKLLVAGIDSTDDVVIDLASATAATWRQEPLTLRDDAVIIEEAEPTEEEIFSHENDDPEDVEFTEGATQATGSFTRPTIEQMVGLMGGQKDETAYLKPKKKVYIDRAIRFRLQGGGYVVLPRAKGYATMSLGLGRGSRAKFPFKLKALVPKGGETALIWETEKDADTPQGRSVTDSSSGAPASAPTPPKEETKK